MLNKGESLILSLINQSEVLSSSVDNPHQILSSNFTLDSLGVPLFGFPLRSLLCDMHITPSKVSSIALYLITIKLMNSIVTLQLSLRNVPLNWPLLSLSSTIDDLLFLAF